MINHEQQYIFIHVPKAGGNSIKEALGIPKFPGDHSRISHEKYNDFLHYFKFAFVRNPYARAVSAYFFLKEGGMVKPNGVRVDERPAKRVAKYKDFCDFIKNDRHFSSMVHFKAQTIPLQSEPSKKIDNIDFIGKCENMQNDFNTICDKIGIPHQQLPHKNKSKHGHYAQYYDDETREIITEKFAIDIENFGYKFEDPISGFIN